MRLRSRNLFGSTGNATGLLAQGSWALGAEVLVFAGMALSFVVLPTRLTEEEYGILGGVQALVLPAMQLGLLGAPTLLVRRITQGHDVSTAWDRLVAVTLWGSSIVLIALALAQPWLLGPADTVIYLLLILANGFLSTAGDQLFLVHMSMQQMQKATLMRLLYVVPRLVALMALFLAAEPSLLLWAVLFTVASATGFVLCTVHARIDLGLRYRASSVKTMIEDCRQSYGYALTGISDGVLSASDRPILVNSGFGVEAGSYALGYRFVSLAMMPALAMMRATTPRLFAEGRHGISGPFRAARGMAGPTVGLGVVLGLALWLGAPLVRILVDDGYEDVVSIIRWLAVVPLLKSVQYLAGNALDAAAFQHWRFRLTLTAAALNVGLNLIFIPRYSWRAAALSTVAAEAFLMASLWLVAAVIARSDGPLRQPT